MGSVQEIKKRVKSIESTKQITYSMRMVSSAKVKKAQKHLEKTLGFHEGMKSYLQGLFGTNAELDNIYFKNDSNAPAAILIISSDRGLCGAYNMNVTRRAIRLCKENENPYIIVVGSRTKDTLNRENIKVAQSYVGISEAPLYEEAKMISNQLTNLYLKGEIGCTYIVYTTSLSILTQEVRVERLLPCKVPENLPNNREYLIDPSFNELIDKFMPMYLSSWIHNAMTLSALSEQSARITSMDSASKNADELVDKLTLEYNQIRQSEITNEINEIVSGAAGVNN